MHSKTKSVILTLDRIINGGQAIGKSEEGKKILVWGGLPGEKVEVNLTKQKSKWAEGYVIKVIEPSSDRIDPVDKDSYLSTSPWQIMNYDAELRYKQQLIQESFDMYKLNLPIENNIIHNDKIYGYRNKMEFSFWWEKETSSIDLAFFKRGGHGKIPVTGSAIAMPIINKTALEILQLLKKLPKISARDLKTLIIRSNQSNVVSAQLYVKNKQFPKLTQKQFDNLNINGLEVIYSNPESPASVITKLLQNFGKSELTDNILDKSFNYNVGGFFQINLPIYEMVLLDIKNFITDGDSIVDLYSGVGTIGLSVANSHLVLIESNSLAYNELLKNVNNSNNKNIKTINMPAEKALDEFDEKSIIIVDPPRAGLHNDLIEFLLLKQPDKIIYLSCNPVTQARDVLALSSKYTIIHNKGYNFFPRTPHIEHLLVLEKTIS